MKIITSQVGDEWRAWIEGSPGYWGNGRSRETAIGSLILSHAEKFGLIIE